MAVEKNENRKKAVLVVGYDVNGGAAKEITFVSPRDAVLGAPVLVSGGDGSRYFVVDASPVRNITDK